MHLAIIAGIAVTGCAVALGNVSRAAEPAPVASMPTPAVGDVLVYKNNFVTVACSRWQITATNQNGFIVSRCGDDTAYYKASNGALVRITDKRGDDLVSFKPFSPSIQFPLQVGKSWKGTYSGVTTADESAWDSVQSCKVIDWETVQVPAGAMPAFRIDCTDNWTSSGYAGTSSNTSWYSPEAHALVKVLDVGQPKWNMELVSYTVH
ncbi:hypothetical protein [Lichenicoccus sp.]|uniref:hypothetical protein n=1 Tax=Lichenicoccus sp. TaxID=2781899 RepID=UPI003D0C0F0D